MSNDQQGTTGVEWHADGYGGAVATCGDATLSVNFVRVVHIGLHDDAPAIRRGELALAGTVEKWKWLRFVCPCGCGELLALNLMQSASPSWTVDEHEDGTLTVHPSVDAQKCGAHFWIRRNRIHWC